jgi:hypothetical protein
VSESGASTMSSSAQRRALDRPGPEGKGAAFWDKVDAGLGEGAGRRRGLTSAPISSSSLSTTSTIRTAIELRGGGWASPHGVEALVDETAASSPTNCSG